MRYLGEKRAGFSLLEVLVVMAAVGLFLAMGTALMYGYTKLNTASAWNLESLTQGRDLAEAWCRDVRLAKAGPVPVKPEDKASQILELPEGTVAWKLENGRLVRLVVGTNQQKAWILGPGKTWVEFTVGDRPDLVVLRYGDDRVNGRHVRGECTALRGGDLP